MRKVLFSLVLLAFVAAFVSSCSRGITPYEAANGRAKCGRYIR